MTSETTEPTETTPAVWTASSQDLDYLRACTACIHQANVLAGCFAAGSSSGPVAAHLADQLHALTLALVTPESDEEHALLQQEFGPRALQDALLTMTLGLLLGAGERPVIRAAIRKLFNELWDAVEGTHTLTVSAATWQAASSDVLPILVGASGFSAETVALVGQVIRARAAAATADPDPAGPTPLDDDPPTC